MKLLLDTQVWLWTLVSPERLSRPIRGLLTDNGNELYLSVASCWEIAIKYQLGKLSLPEEPTTFIAPRLVRDGIRDLPVLLEHAVGVGRLPPIHRDPFDRLLVSQAKAEKMPLVSADAELARYDVEVIMC